MANKKKFLVLTGKYGAYFYNLEMEEVMSLNKVKDELNSLNYLASERLNIINSKNHQIIMLKEIIENLHKKIKKQDIMIKCRDEIATNNANLFERMDNEIVANGGKSRIP